MTRHPPPRPDTPGATHAGRYGQQVGGVHPTGMQSCIILYFCCSISCMQNRGNSNFCTEEAASLKLLQKRFRNFSNC